MRPPTRHQGLAAAIVAGAASATLIAAPAGAACAGAAPAPLSFGHYHAIDRAWRVKVVERDLHADAAIADANIYNAPPRSGYRYVTVKVRGRKTSAGSGDLDFDEEFRLLGHRTHTLYREAAEVAPDDLLDQNEVARGGTVSGNILFEVKKADLSAGHVLLRIDSVVNLNGHPKYFQTH
jgi:hypothetical protein